MLKYIVIGILIGIGAILPGISSGVICVMTGVYEKLLDIVVNFFKNIKYNVKILLPLGIGIALGMCIFSKVLEHLILEYPIHIKSIFVGLILGGVPMLFKSINKQNKKIKNKFKYIALILSCTIGIGMFIYEKSLNINTTNYEVNNMYLIFAGIIMSVGIVVPGVSSTVILMCLGVYSIYLTAIANMDIGVLIPMGIGMVIGSVFWIKAIKWLFKNYYIQTYYAIIGFTICSSLVLFPNIYSLYDAIVVVIGIFFGINVCRLLEKRQNNITYEGYTKENIKH